MEEVKHQREQQQAINEANGIKCDVEFQMKVTQEKAKVVEMRQHEMADVQPQQNICVRKRPLFP